VRADYAFFCVSYLPSCVCNFENLNFSKVSSLSQKLPRVAFGPTLLEYYAFAQPADTRRTADTQTASALSFSDGAVHGASVAIFF
jgi:hypothetical protein